MEVFKIFSTSSTSILNKLHLLSANKIDDAIIEKAFIDRAL
jgi:hypothetical protein